MIFRRRKRGQSEPPAESGTPDTGPPEGGTPDLGTPEGGPEGAPDESAPTGLISGTRAALAPVKKRHVVVASLGLMGFAAAGVLLFSAASFWWTSQPSFCNKCHVMEPYVAAWERSSHADVNCEACHLQPGFFGFLGGKISGLQVVMNYIRGTYEDYSFNAAVSNGSCLQCHDEILAGNVHNAESGITVSHLDIIEMGGKCLNCHSTVAHGNEVPEGAATHPTMETCLTCHDDKIAPLDCDLCHTGREPPSEQAHASPTASTGTG
jgi:nitrate/TMAO reductase-like tetraheme cytochrome c subunit